MITNKYKAYRSKRNRKVHELIDIASEVYNHTVALYRRHYKLYGKNPTKGKVQSHINTKLRRKNLRWQKLNSQTTQQIVERVDDAYGAFFEKTTKAPPGFRKRRKYKSFTFKQSGYKLQGNTLTINSIGLKIKFHLSRPYGTPRTVTVKRDKVGDIWICIVADPLEKPKPKAKTGKTAGFDFGLKTFFRASDDSEVINPQFFKREINKVKKASRNLSSKKRGSGNRRRARIELARTHRRLAWKREAYQWQLAHNLLSKYDRLSFETLNIDGMKRMWGRKVSDLAFYSFMLKVKYLAKKYGKEVVEVDQWLASSKTCSGCQHKKEKLELSEREFVCESCGLVIERDLNAAINIDRAGAAAPGPGKVRAKKRKRKAVSRKAKASNPAIPIKGSHLRVTGESHAL